MKKYTFQENYEIKSVDEGWFDNISQAAQKAYIQKFPNSKFAKNTKKKEDAEQLKKLDQEIQALDDAKWKAVDSGDGAAIRNWGEKLQKAKAKREKMSRTGNELNQETLTIDGKQFRRISEGVEKQPKPKYEFSEFYQRFKR